MEMASTLSAFATGALRCFAVLCAHAELPPAAIMVSNASVATMFRDTFAIVSPLILILHYVPKVGWNLNSSPSMRY